MRVYNIQWDEHDIEENNVDTLQLPDSIEIPDRILLVDKRDTAEKRYNDVVDAISEYITDLTGVCHDGFFVEITKSDVERFFEGNDMTLSDLTPEERENLFDVYTHGSSCLKYAVIAQMDYIDLEEWQALNEALGKEISWSAASKIITTLYENHDSFTPKDITPCQPTVENLFHDVQLTAEEAHDFQKILEQEGISLKTNDNITMIYFMKDEINKNCQDGIIMGYAEENEKIKPETLQEYLDVYVSGVNYYRTEDIMSFADYVMEQIEEDFNITEKAESYLIDYLVKVAYEKDEDFGKAFEKFLSDKDISEILTEAGYNGVEVDWNSFLPNNYKIERMKGSPDDMKKYLKTLSQKENNIEMD